MQTIAELIAVLSFPHGWILRSITFDENTGVFVEYWPPTGHDAWKEGTIVGRGKTVDDALRDAQKWAWERYMKYQNATGAHRYGQGNKTENSN